MFNITTILLTLPSILLALTIHEYAHGLVAYKLGDPTAKEAGRLTFNPLAHLDLMGTIAIILIHIGWAKPVPVNPYYFRNPKRDMIWVSAAGPASNILLAFIFGILFQLLHFFGLLMQHPVLYIVISFTIFINLILAIFNLIPIPPLDGSKIVGGLIPLQHLRLWEEFERKGMFILLGLIMINFMLGINVFRPIFWMANFLFLLMTGTSSPFH